MASSLSKTQIEQYWDDGFLFPLDVVTAKEAVDYRSQLECIERCAAEQYNLPLPLKRYLLSHADVVMPMVAQLALKPTVLDAVESIIGPNLMVWSANFFIKEANSDSIISMHQDLTYWGFGETSDQVTAWIALSPSTEQSGCMDLVKGSHKNPILPHNDTFAQNNLLSRGQEVAVDVSDDQRTRIQLMPGQMSLHHGLAIHGSKPNTSSDRRIGLAIRYINPGAQQKTVAREYAMMARGVDHSEAFIHYAAADALFSDASLKLHDQITRAQAKVLMSDAN